MCSLLPVRGLGLEVQLREAGFSIRSEVLQSLLSLRLLLRSTLSLSLAGSSPSSCSSLRCSFSARADTEPFGMEMVAVVGVTQNEGQRMLELAWVLPGSRERQSSLRPPRLRHGSSSRFLPPLFSFTLLKSHPIEILGHISLLIMQTMSRREQE